MKPEAGVQNQPNHQPDETIINEEHATGASTPVVVQTSINPARRVLRWISMQVFSYESTYLPLVFLWVLGVIWAISEMVRALPVIIKPQEAGILTPLFIVIIKIQLALGFSHQFIVFRCIHVFDSNREVWKERFPNWIGTRIEWFLRALILLTLLGAGGEIPLLAKHIRDTYHHHLHEIPFYTYPACSVALYCVLNAWDIAGALRAPQPSSKLLKFWKLLWPSYPLTLRHVYFYSDALCLIFWLAILWCTKDMRIGAISFLSVLLTFILFVAMTVHRIYSHVKSTATTS